MSEHDREQVLCEDCGQANAVCTVAVMMGTRVIHRKLCQACMAKAGMSIAAGNLGQVLGAMLAAARNTAQQAPQAVRPAVPPVRREEPLPEVSGDEAVCPQCGMTSQQYRESCRPGCAACCTAFRGTLTEALKRRGSSLVHTGRRPAHSEEAQRDRAWREEMQRQLDEAIAREDYETAAVLRDTLRGSMAQGGQMDE